MALKALVQIREFDYDFGFGLTFKLKIFCLDPPNNTDNVLTGDIGVQATDAASVVNSKIGQFVKDYCTTTWEATWGIADTVRILAAVDSIL